MKTLRIIAYMEKVTAGKGMAGAPFSYQI